MEAQQEQKSASLPQKKTVLNLSRGFQYQQHETIEELAKLKESLHSQGRSRKGSPRSKEASGNGPADMFKNQRRSSQGRQSSGGFSTEEKKEDIFKEDGLYGIAGHPSPKLVNSALLKSPGSGEKLIDQSGEQEIKNLKELTSKVKQKQLYDQRNLSPETQKHLNQYHKCLYALIKVLTKRMTLFYQADFAQLKELEQTEIQFRSVLAKILTKMKEIEEKCNNEVGKEATHSMLLPFTHTIRPILKLVGIKMISPDDPISTLLQNKQFMEATATSQKRSRTLQNRHQPERESMFSQEPAAGETAVYSKFVTVDELKKLQRLSRRSQTSSKRLDTMQSDEKASALKPKMSKLQQEPQILSAIPSHNTSRVEKKKKVRYQSLQASKGPKQSKSQRKLQTERGPVKPNTSRKWTTTDGGSIDASAGERTGSTVVYDPAAAKPIVAGRSSKPGASDRMKSSQPSMMPKGKALPMIKMKPARMRPAPRTFQLNQESQASASQAPQTTEKTVDLTARGSIEESPEVVERRVMKPEEEKHGVPKPAKIPKPNTVNYSPKKILREKPKQAKQQNTPAVGQPQNRPGITQVKQDLKIESKRSSHQTSTRSPPKESKVETKPEPAHQPIIESQKPEEELDLKLEAAKEKPANSRSNSQPAKVPSVTKPGLKPNRSLKGLAKKKSIEPAERQVSLQTKTTKKRLRPLQTQTNVLRIEAEPSPAGKLHLAISGAHTKDTLDNAEATEAARAAHVASEALNTSRERKAQIVKMVQRVPPSSTKFQRIPQKKSLSPKDDRQISLGRTLQHKGQRKNSMALLRGGQTEVMSSEGNQLLESIIEMSPPKTSKGKKRATFILIEEDNRRTSQLIRKEQGGSMFIRNQPINKSLMAKLPENVRKNFFKLDRKLNKQRSHRGEIKVEPANRFVNSLKPAQHISAMFNQTIVNPSTLMSTPGKAQEAIVRASTLEPMALGNPTLSDTGLAEPSLHGATANFSEEGHLPREPSPDDYSPPKQDIADEKRLFDQDISQPTQCNATTEDDGQGNEDYNPGGDRTAPGSSAPASSMVQTIHQHIGDIRHENNFYIVNISNPQGKQTVDQASRGTRVSSKANPLSEISKRQEHLVQTYGADSNPQNWYNDIRKRGHPRQHKKQHTMSHGSNYTSEIDPPPINVVRKPAASYYAKCKSNNQISRALQGRPSDLEGKHILSFHSRPNKNLFSGPNIITIDNQKSISKCESNKDIRVQLNQQISYANNARPRTRAGGATAAGTMGQPKPSETISKQFIVSSGNYGGDAAHKNFGVNSSQEPLSIDRGDNLNDLTSASNDPKANQDLIRDFLGQSSPNEAQQRTKAMAQIFEQEKKEKAQGSSEILSRLSKKSDFVTLNLKDGKGIYSLNKKLHNKFSNTHFQKRYGGLQSQQANSGQRINQIAGQTQTILKSHFAKQSMPIGLKPSFDEAASGQAALEQFYSSAGMQVPSGETGMGSSNQFSKNSGQQDDRGRQTLNPMGYQNDYLKIRDQFSSDLGSSDSLAQKQQHHRKACMTTLESIYQPGAGTSISHSVPEEEASRPYHTYYIHNRKAAKESTSMNSGGSVHIKKGHRTLAPPIFSSERDKHLSLDAADELYSKLKVKPSLLNPVLMRATKTQMQYLTRSIDSAGRQINNSSIESSVYQIPLNLRKHPKFVKMSEETVPSPQGKRDPFKKGKSSSLVDTAVLDQFVSQDGPLHFSKPAGADLEASPKQNPRLFSEIKQKQINSIYDSKLKHHGLRLKQSYIQQQHHTLRQQIRAKKQELLAAGVASSFEKNQTERPSKKPKFIKKVEVHPEPAKDATLSSGAGTLLQSLNVELLKSQQPWTNKEDVEGFEGVEVVNQALPADDEVLSGEASYLAEQAEMAEV